MNDGPLFERALEKFYRLVAQVEGLREDEAAADAASLMVKWRWMGTGTRPVVLRPAGKGGL